ncbi:MAG: hypothetical protein QXX17_00680 [Conexivisphaerales archaeon]
MEEISFLKGNREVRENAEQRVNGVILECIEKALEPLGAVARESIFRLFETRTGMSKKKIPDNADAFLGHLENLFGKPATSTLEAAMKREIGKRFAVSNVTDGNLSSIIKFLKDNIKKSES